MDDSRKMKPDVELGDLSGGCAVAAVPGGSSFSDLE